MAEIGETRRYEPDPEYSYSAEEFTRRVRGIAAPTVRAPQKRAATSTTPSFGRSAMKRGAQADPLLGQKVRHPDYGVGPVVGVEGEDDDRRGGGSFLGGGTEKFGSWGWQFVQGWRVCSA